MELDFVLNFYKHFGQDSIVLLYAGYFNDFVLLNTTDIIKKYDIEEDFEKDKIKMIFLMIEAFQNVIRYADIEKSDFSDLIGRFFLARKTNKDIFIATSNLIEKYKKQDLKKRLDDLNSKNTDQLKELFLEVLTNKEFSDRGGAGLGFIEMRRKTKIQLDYFFDDINENLSYFYFLTKLLNNKTENSFIKMNLDDFKQIHHDFSKNKVVFFIKNNFNEETINSVLPVFQENLKDLSKNYQKLTYHLMLETLQNISKHAANIQNKKDAVFLLSKHDDCFEIASGNLIRKDDIEYLDNYLKELSGMQKNELDIKFLQRLVDADTDRIGGLGFIEIARESKNFTFNFFDYDQNYSFFTFSVKIDF